MYKTLFLLLSFAFLTFSFKGASDGGLVFSDKYSETVREARKEGKPVLVMVCTNHCPICSRMKTSTFKDPQLAEYMNENFAMVMLDPDLPVNSLRVSKWNLKSVPAAVFMDSNGDVQKIMLGYMSPAQMLDVAQKVAE